MSVITSFPVMPPTRNALSPREAAEYITGPAYANEAALDTSLAALTSTVAALPTSVISATVPDTGVLGSFWLDSSTSNQLKICNATYGSGATGKAAKWTSIRDMTSAAAASSAQSTANTPAAVAGSAFPDAFTQYWIWVDSSSGAAYMCNTTYTAALPPADRASKFTSMANAATDAAVTLVKSAVDDMGDDEKITPSEKLVLQREWTQIGDNKTAMTSLATALALTSNADYVAAMAAYTALDTYLNTTLTVFADLTATTDLVAKSSTRTVWNTKWTTWYSTNAVFAKTASDSLKTDIDSNQSDETITQAEARDYEVRWNYEVKNRANHEETVDALVKANLVVKGSNSVWLAYASAYTTLDTYLNTTLALFSVTTWPFLLSSKGSSAAEWRSKWDAYTTAERAMSVLGNTTLAANIDAIGDDNNVSATEKFTVRAAWVNINGVSLEANPGDGEYKLLRDRATALIAAGYDLSAMKSSLDSNFSALYTYLITTLGGSTTGGIFDMTVATVVNDVQWDGAWNGYYNAYAALDAAATAAVDADTGLVTGLIDDEKITAGKEKQDLIELFDNIKMEKTYILAKAAAIPGTSTTAYSAAYTALETYLYGVFTNQAGFENKAVTASGISRSAWASAFQNYYEAREALESQLIQTLNNNLSRDSASIPNMATDGTITVEEKYVAQQYWATIYGTADNGEHDALRDQATNLGVLSAYITSFNESYNRLGNFIDTSTGTDYGTPYAGATALDLFDDMGVVKALTAAQQAEWQADWNGYYTNRDAITLHITNALQANLDAKLSRDGTLAMTGTLNMGGFQVSNLLVATASAHAVRFNEYNSFLSTVPFARDTPNQFSAMTAKAALVGADMFVIEDSADSANKKKATVSQIQIGFGAPTGAVTAYAGSTAPAGWLLADGLAINRTTYATLFGVIGTTYGVGDNSTTFNLPDLRSRVPIAPDTSPNTGAASRVSSNNTLAAASGAQSDTLSAQTIPDHTHNYSGTSTAGSKHSHTATDSGHDHDTPGGTASAAGGGILVAFDGSTGTTGSATANVTIGDESVHTHTFSGTSSGSSAGGLAHNNMQPYLVLNYIIKT